MDRRKKKRILKKCRKTCILIGLYHSSGFIFNMHETVLERSMGWDQSNPVISAGIYKKNKRYNQDSTQQSCLVTNCSPVWHYRSMVSRTLVLPALLLHTHTHWGLSVSSALESVLCFKVLWTSQQLHVNGCRLLSLTHIHKHTHPSFSCYFHSQHTLKEKHWQHKNTSKGGRRR